MHIVWSKYIRSDYLWEPECFGLFYKPNHEITFYFKENSNVLALSEKDNEPRIIYSCFNEVRLSLPQKWAIVEDSNNTFLLFSENQGFNLKKNEFSYHVPIQVQAAYNRFVRPEKYYVEEAFDFGKCRIEHKGNCGYVCKTNGIPMWEFRGKAYLYTDIVQWNNRVFFGTAGNSGYFYVLDIESGKNLVSIKTGGTRSFVQLGNLCYILSNEKNAQLLCIDLSSGRTIGHCDLPGTATVNSKIAIVDNLIQTITYDFAGQIPRSAIWSCIEL